MQVNRPLFPAIFAVLVLAGLGVRVLAAHAWDPLAFVLDTPPGIDPGRGWGVGYDGRFAYHMAVNPLGSTAGLDEPNYRYQRIVYPLLVKLLSAGDPARVPWMMILVNAAAAGAGCFFLGAILARRRASPWWALGAAFSIGSLLAFRMDLLEPLALALAVAGGLAWEEDRRGAAVILFTLAGLTKEMVLLFPLAAAAAELLRRRRQAAVQLGGIPAAVFLGWYAFLAATFGVPPAAIEKIRLLWVPFSGLAYVSDSASLAVIALWTVVPAAVGGAAAAVEAVRLGKRMLGGDSALETRSQAAAALLAAGHLGLVATLPAAVWVDPLAMLRVGFGLAAALILWLAGGKRLALAGVFGLYLFSGAVLLLIPGLL